MSDVIRLKINSKKIKAKIPDTADYLDEFGLTPEEVEKKKKDEQREQELKQAYEKGYNEGFETAKSQLEKQYTDDLVSKTQEYYNILKDFESNMIEYEESFNKIIIESAVKIAETIIKTEIENKSIIEKSIDESVQRILGANEVVIKIHPSDYSLITEEGKDKIIEQKFSKIRFQEDINIEKGGCLIETEIGNVDSRLSTQLDEITKRLEQKLLETDESD